MLKQNFLIFLSIVVIVLLFLGGCMDRIKNLDFLRIVGCFAILFYHIFCVGNFFPTQFFDYMKYYTLDGNKGVELFFILSGLFLVLGFKKEVSVFEFFKKRFFRLYPLLFLVIIFYNSIPFLRLDITKSLINLTCLSAMPFVLEQGRVIFMWFVSALLWVSLLFYYLMKNFDEKNVKLFASICAILCYGFITRKYDGAITEAYEFCFFLNVGLLRALAGISVGYLIGLWYRDNSEKIKNLEFNLWQKVLLTCAEAYFLLLSVLLLMVNSTSCKNQIVFVILFVAIIFLFLLNKGFVSNILNNDISSCLGKYTYSIYMVHTPILAVFSHFYKDNLIPVDEYPVVCIFVFILTIFLFGILTYHFVEKPAYSFLCRRFLEK